MKRKVLIVPVIAIMNLVACQKANDSATQISLTPSTTQAVVGQTVSVQLSSGKNASSWTVSPSTAVTEAYAITTKTVNYFTFNRAGVYTIGVRARNIEYDSTHLSLDSCWHHGGGDTGPCTRGVDSASVSIKVVN